MKKTVTYAYIYARLLSSLLILSLVVGIAVINIGALTPTGKISSDYKEGKYYKNLISLNLTGDERTDIIMVAMSQLGYHEGNSEADFDGENSTGTKNYVEYNYLYGKVDGDGNGSTEYGYAWCAAFVSWCARQAAISTSTVKSYVSCTNWVSWFKASSTYKTRDSGYIPVSGDIIFFKDAAATRASTHVGIVVYTDSNTVYTIEGNSGGKVGMHEYGFQDTYIVGYGVPSYKTDDSKKIDYSRTELHPGIYITSADSLNFRSGPATSYSAIGSIPIGSILKIEDIENGWGKAVYEGRTGYLHMAYAYLVSYESYSITFNLRGGLFDISIKSKKAGETITIPSESPTKEGYEFVGWSDTAGGDVKYKPGDTYSADLSITLYAIWKDAEYTITFCNYDGTLLEEQTYKYLEKINAPEATPMKESDESFFYVFTGWEPSFYVAKSSQTYTAVFEAHSISEITDIITAEGPLSTEEPSLTTPPELSSKATESENNTSIGGSCSAAISGITSMSILALFAAAVISKKRQLK